MPIVLSSYTSRLDHCEATRSTSIQKIIAPSSNQGAFGCKCAYKRRYIKIHPDCRIAGGFPDLSLPWLTIPLSFILYPLLVTHK